MSDEDWLRVLAVNLSGAFFIAQAALDHMIERGTGRIISVSSVIGETGNIGQANYAASKSGLFGLTKSLAREAIFQLNRAQRPAGDGIGVTVNAVTPGYIATDMMATIPDKALDRIRGQIPVGRLGRQMRSPVSSASWPLTSLPTSPGRSGPSTADWICEGNVMNDLRRRPSPVRGTDRYRPLRRRAGRRAALRPGRDRGARSGVRQPSRAPMVNTQSTASGCSATRWTRLTNSLPSRDVGVPARGEGCRPCTNPGSAVNHLSAEGAKSWSST